MTPSPLTRREALESAGIGLLGATLLGAGSSEAADAAPRPLNRFPRMLQEHFVRQLRLHDEIHRRRIMGLKTRAEALQYVKDVRQRIELSFGPWPKKTDLRPRITGRLERDGYNVEKVIFESRPGFPVTANLYLPTGIDRPVPGVVGTCGHSTNGKQAEFYQAFAQGLARQGHACLIYDPIGQGERFQYAGPEARARVRPGVGEHIQTGNQQLLVGEFFGSWRAWDGIRALDYLLTRPEVDSRHLGVTGNSGGGTMTTWLAGVDPRWTMAAPSCFVTTFRHNLENELPADSEQCPPRVLALGLDHCDFLAAMAPHPVVILAKEKDYFDVRGSEEALARLRHLYRLLGKPDNVSLFVGPSYHGFSQENREAMYRLFNHATGIARAEGEPPITIEKDEDLWCTPEGQVGPTGAKTVFQFTRERSRALASQRRPLGKKRLFERVREQLNLPSASGVPHYRILRHLGGRGYPAKYDTHYVVETEPGIHAVVTRLSTERHYSRPPRSGSAAVLYLAHLSSDAELRQDAWLRDQVTASGDTPFYACDLRGTGDSQPDTCGPDTFLKPYGSDFFYASHSLMLDRPYVGQRTFDAMRVMEWLQSCGHTRIHLLARGRGSIPGAFAALLSDAVDRVTLRESLDSYREVAETELYDTPLSMLLPGVLLHFDLPDIYQALGSSKLQRV
jgi:dienelactone hydrolase